MRRRCASRLQAEPLSLRELSLAGHVALTGDILNLHDTYMIPPDRPYAFDPRVDARVSYRTQSILVVPLQDPAHNILGRARADQRPGPRPGRALRLPVRVARALARVAGRRRPAQRAPRGSVLQGRADGRVQPPLLQRPDRRGVQASLPLRRAAVARPDGPRSLQGSQRSLRPPRRRRGAARRRPAPGEALAKLQHRHALRGRRVRDHPGEHRRRRGGLTYSERIRNVIEQHRFTHAPVTASLGVASLPEDATTVDDLIVAADRALYDAKRLGRNRAAAP